MSSPRENIIARLWHPNIYFGLGQGWVHRFTSELFSVRFFPVSFSPPSHLARRQRCYFGIPESGHRLQVNLQERTCKNPPSFRKINVAEHKISPKGVAQQRDSHVLSVVQNIFAVTKSGDPRNNAANGNSMQNTKGSLDSRSIRTATGRLFSGKRRNSESEPGKT